MQEELTRESQYTRSLIEASLDPFVTISTHGKITDVNGAFVKITGIAREGLVGTNFSNYFTEPQRAQEGYRQVFDKGFVSDYPLTITHVRGTLTDVLYNASVYKDERGVVRGVFAAARDITDQKRIATELQEAKVAAEQANALAQEARSKAERATRIAEDAVKSKQQFLSNMSHEIRTPMNAIIGFTKVALKTSLTDKQKEYLHAIKISGDALIVLINDILDLAKIEAGKMTFEKTPFRMASSISSMLHLFEAKLQEMNLQLVKKYDKNIPDVLLGDPMRLHQIILNLVSNAVKFTSTGSITVSVRLLSQDENTATIEFAVSDTGIGIPPEKIDTIFDNFQQASVGTSRLYGGTGLGLAIVKQLVEPQGGSIHVESKTGVGSTFSFTLSFEKTKIIAEPEEGGIEFDTEVKNLKVLVVEDIALNQLLMETLLNDFGFEHDIAENGKIAVEKLAAKTYDLVLMDLQMPIMNGFEATRHIRTKMKSNIPIIALTADVTTVDLAKCRSVGMNDYIAKPVDENVLYNKITAIIKQTRKIVKYNEDEWNTVPPVKKSKYVDLDYLLTRTKSNPKLTIKMISVYLEQTPPMIAALKNSLHEQNWLALKEVAHKLIPSFSIIGMSPEFEEIAKKIQTYSGTNKNMGEIPGLVALLDNACTCACAELQEELEALKLKNNEK